MCHNATGKLKIFLSFFFFFLCYSLIFWYAPRAHLADAFSNFLFRFGMHLAVRG